jgi:predicted lipid-binding transport protein (Tim44 family)
MALSEREKKVLEEIERDLCGADGKYATMLPAARARSQGHRSTMPIIAGATVGMALVMVGLVSNTIIVSILGFLVLVATTAFATSSLSPLRGASKRSADAATQTPAQVDQPSIWKHLGRRIDGA